MEMSISMRWIIKKFFWWRGLYGCLALTELKTCRESWKGMFTLRNLITNVELSSYNAACYIWRYTTALEMNGWMNFNIIFTTWRIFIILNIIFVDLVGWFFFRCIVTCMGYLMSKSKCAYSFLASAKYIFCTQLYASIYIYNVLLVIGL